jgi:hypothetical protein
MFKNVKISIYITIPLPEALHWCETWSLILRLRHRLRAFEKKVLKRIFGPTRDEVTGGGRNLQNEELHNLYSSSGTIRMVKSRRVRWEFRVAQMVKRNEYTLFVGKGTRRQETTRKTKMDLGEI